ncbi:Serpentine type 7TM GPCR chemoreceptor Srsx [Dermatophagoides pteronyssinus]|uniref:Serpentine type 7TM GPCR chemoreceptor Srsx n=1 Tax=Dermatophagoides pteronyssinus TaxID=6956 RepID=A0ABQ8JVT6_DERPT|nr:Serpentine type 7TM GPCR chemoreceptor Srsx [Dermatophagoides pteronyssinus]
MENISKIETIARVPSFELPVSIFVENEQQQQQQISAEFDDDNDDEIDKDFDQQQQQQNDFRKPTSFKTLFIKFNLTPTYAVISSCISFYLPCLIMLCLYARLYSICKHHVKTIKSMTKMTTTFQQQQQQPGFIIVDKQKQQQQNNRLLPGSIQMTINNDDDDDNQIVLDDNNDQKQKNKRNLSSTSTNPVSNLNHHQHQHQSHVSEHKAAITLGIIMGTFLACWMPFFCMNIVAAFCKTCIPASVFKLLTWLGYFNSCLNPAIYSIFNTEFRDAFRRILVRYVFSSETMSQTCNHICKNPCRSSATSATTTAAIDKKQSLSLTTTKILNIDHESERKNIQSKIKEEDDNNVNNRHSFQQQQQFSNNKNIVETLSFKSSTSLNDITSSKRINDNDAEDKQSLRADNINLALNQQQQQQNHQCKPDSSSMMIPMEKFSFDV